MLTHMAVRPTLVALPAARANVRRVINGSRRASELGPFIPQQRTCGASGSMSEKCQRQISRPSRAHVRVM
jgi:hypothetical protein